MIRLPKYTVSGGLKSVVDAKLSRYGSRLRLTQLATRSASTGSEPAPEEITVSLNDDPSNMPVRNFFQYSWGTWLQNNVEERAKRETKFSLKGLVEIIKSNVGADIKAPDTAELEVKRVASLYEGHHHRVYRIDLADGRSYVLRIPYAVGSDIYRKKRMQSEIATMDFLKKRHDLLLPEVIAWSPVKDTVLESEYTILEFIKGHSLIKDWNPGSTDLAEKSKVIKPVVDIMTKIVSTPFNQYGSLYFTQDVSDTLQQAGPAYEGETDAELKDRWRIGPTTESRFWKNSLPEDSSLRGPWKTAPEYFNAATAIAIESAKEKLNLPGGQDALEALEKFSHIAPNIFLQSELDPELFTPRLHNPDLDPKNIIVKEIEKTEGAEETDSAPPSYALLDVENTAIKPFIVHSTPEFVRHTGPKIFSKDEVPDYENLSDTDKASVDHFMARTQNQFAFEYLFLHTKSPLINAYAPGIKRRQEPFTILSNISFGSDDYLDLTDNLLRLSEEWKGLGLDRPSPITFTPEEKEKFEARFKEYSERVLKNPFYGSKGWVPQQLFETLLGQGAITKEDNGNYTLNLDWSKLI